MKVNLIGSGSGDALRDKLDDDCLDLPLIQLNEVPIKEMAALTKGTFIDLLNYLLTFLPDTFPTLTHIVKVDLSKNQLSELPEYFGQLRSLRHLDLPSASPISSTTPWSPRCSRTPGPASLPPTVPCAPKMWWLCLLELLQE